MGFKIHVRTPAIYVKFIVNKVPLKHLWIKQPGIPDQGMKGFAESTYRIEHRQILQG
jgi:hypothetical protein